MSVLAMSKMVMMGLTEEGGRIERLDEQPILPEAPLKAASYRLHTNLYSTPLSPSVLIALLLSGDIELKDGVYYPTEKAKQQVKEELRDA